MRMWEAVENSERRTQPPRGGGSRGAIVKEARGVASKPTSALPVLLLRPGDTLAVLEAAASAGLLEADSSMVA